jgi:hypothetical protein
MSDLELMCKIEDADNYLVVALWASEYKTQINIRRAEPTIDDDEFVLNKDVDFEVNSADLIKAIVAEIARQEKEHDGAN